jgi:glycosyltransferase involved in cell wall biosynthesis
MSVYYKEKSEYLRESVVSMLKQTIAPDEIILVKDGPLTDDLEKVIDEFKNYDIFKIVSIEQNVGFGKALNIGLNECRNELVARMDTDDISREDRCEKQLNLFIENELVSIVSSAIAEFDKGVNNINSIKRLPTKHQDIVKFSKKRNPFNHPAVMYKKSEVIKAGGYKHFTLFEDYYLWARMILNGAVCCNIDEPLVYMRANENMYKRRGGISYFKCILKFKWHMLRIGFYSWTDFIISTLTQGALSLLPNRLRIIIYKELLRE